MVRRTPVGRPPVAALRSRRRLRRRSRSPSGSSLTRSSTHRRYAFDVAPCAATGGRVGVAHRSARARRAESEPGLGPLAPRFVVPGAVAADDDAPHTRCAACSARWWLTVSSVCAPILSAVPVNGEKNSFCTASGCTHPAARTASAAAAATRNRRGRSLGLGMRRSWARRLDFVGIEYGGFGDHSRRTPVSSPPRSGRRSSTPMNSEALSPPLTARMRSLVRSAIAPRCSIRLLLDSHALLWTLLDDPKLPEDGTGERSGRCRWNHVGYGRDSATLRVR